ncbi:CDP-diacylglycerol--glycerol-3-phosphate 3-phosphatidyltransferase [Oceanomicrobium pacificus]|uniref:CDP-diacylglycerol--glycerol-3-phosphate 3-phosphatidyltransferase n=1 Tax=Oceanomicrobium pacificus TaxID=2692916 RepID=A0A6B0U0Q3_9RHOB|nr:CDP-diacylglycerol--glycerol-3-phosphate 3-phosphatidyltransferase [Oceanomicrobium pacificus]MXU66784.1 CDP-diacylglycerol--glycerol-3-phosphate 3-phosphatidyltransferase [Oceanomicrobium pacificus]
MRWTIPNILTVIRLLAAPAVALSFAVFPRPFADLLAVILFVGAAVTDYLDGYLARRFDWGTSFGKMLDPIADKAMVIIALTVVVGVMGMTPLIIVPVAAILLREVFVSGLREFLGADAARLQVTKLAKWKTTVQMIAIPVLMVSNLFAWMAIMAFNQLGVEAGEAVLSGAAPDDLGLLAAHQLASWTRWLGLAMLWIAAGLTLVTGFDYLRKAMPFMREREG